MNGRVDLFGKREDSDNAKYECRWIDGCHPDRFSLHDKIPINTKTATFNNVLRGTHESNLLSTMFFSRKNIEIIQNGIRAGVYNASNKNFLIAPQDTDTLLIIMRSIFLQHSVNLPNKISQQISALNKIVIDYSVPQILGEAKGYIKFKHDVSSLAVPLSRPGFMSTAGINTYKLPWPFGDEHCSELHNLNFEGKIKKIPSNREKENKMDWENSKLLKFRDKEMAKILEHQKNQGLKTECFGQLCTVDIPKESETYISKRQRDRINEQVTQKLEVVGHE